MRHIIVFLLAGIFSLSGLAAITWTEPANWASFQKPKIVKNAPNLLVLEAGPSGSHGHSSIVFDTLDISDTRLIFKVDPETTSLSISISGTQPSTLRNISSISIQSDPDVEFETKLYITSDTGLRIDDCAFNGMAVELRSKRTTVGPGGMNATNPLNVRGESLHVRGPLRAHSLWIETDHASISDLVHVGGSFDARCKYLSNRGKLLLHGASRFAVDHAHNYGEIGAKDKLEFNPHKNPTGQFDNFSGRVIGDDRIIFANTRVKNCPKGLCDFEKHPDSVVTVDDPGTPVTALGYPFKEVSKHQRWRAPAAPALIRSKGDLWIYKGGSFQNTMSRVEVGGNLLFDGNTQLEFTQNGANLVVRRELLEVVSKPHQFAKSADTSV